MLIYCTKLLHLLNPAMAVNTMANNIAYTQPSTTFRTCYNFEWQRTMLILCVAVHVFVFACCLCVCMCM